jgi:hypothetical protein
MVDRTRRPQRQQAPIAEAVAGAKDPEDEQLRLLEMIEDNVVCPFSACVIGEPVEVLGLKPAPHGLGLHAICRYKDREYSLDLGSLEWPRKKPLGFQWIEAFLAWQESLD